MKNLQSVDVQIVGIDSDKIKPATDKSLFKFYIELNQIPPSEWKYAFLQHWEKPSSFTSMHRSSIASVEEKFIILNGTTTEEIEKYHQKTLSLVVEETNKSYNAWIDKQRNELKQEEEKKAKQQEEVEKQKNKSKDIKF